MIVSGVCPTNPYPSTDDLANLSSALRTLSSLGVPSGDLGFRMSDLAAAIYTHGWSYDVNRIGSDFQATIRQHHRHAVAVGWTMEVALTFALEQALTSVE